MLSVEVIAKYPNDLITEFSVSGNVIIVAAVSVMASPVVFKLSVFVRVSVELIIKVCTAVLLPYTVISPPGPVVASKIVPCSMPFIAVFSCRFECE